MASGLLDPGLTRAGKLDLVVGLLDNLGFSRPLWWGIRSRSRAVTMALAVHHPQRLAGLVLLGGVCPTLGKVVLLETNHLAGIPLLVRFWTTRCWCT